MANVPTKLQLADQIVQTLGNDSAVIAGAAALVAAEKNFNPFTQSIPTICSDTSLPVTQALRGIVPLVDPAVTGSDTENANSATSLKTPFDATGLSVAQVMAANGFSNFTTQAADGTTGSASAASSGTAAASDDVAAATSAAASATTDAGSVCSAAAAAVTTTVAAAVSTTVADAATAATSDAAASTGAVQQSTIAGLDFGLCVPTMKFERLGFSDGI